MVLNQAVQIPERIKLEKINVIDNGDGKSLASLAHIYPEILMRYIDSVNRILGIDILGNPKRE
jgi:flotillin